MKKFGVTRAKIEKALKEAKEHKITIQGNFIFGDPAETIEMTTADYQIIVDYVTNKAFLPTPEVEKSDLHHIVRTGAMAKQLVLRAKRKKLPG